MESVVLEIHIIRNSLNSSITWSRVSINYVFKMKVFEWDMKREIKLKLKFFSFLNYCGHYTIIIVNNIIFLNGILHEVVMQRGWKRERETSCVTFNNNNQLSQTIIKCLSEAVLGCINFSVHHSIISCFLFLMLPWFMRYSISFCHGHGFCGLLYFH